MEVRFPPGSKRGLLSMSTCMFSTSSVSKSALRFPGIYKGSTELLPSSLSDNSLLIETPYFRSLPIMLTISKTLTVAVAALSAVAFAAPTGSHAARAGSTSVAQALSSITVSVQPYVNQLSMLFPFFYSIEEFIDCLQTVSLLAMLTMPRRISIFSR